MELFRVGESMNVSSIGNILLNGYSCDYDLQKKIANFSFRFDNSREWGIVKKNIRSGVIDNRLIGNRQGAIRLNSGVSKLHLDIDWEQKVFYVNIKMNNHDGDEATLKLLAEEIHQKLLRVDNEPDETNDLFDDFYHQQD